MSVNPWCKKCNLHWDGCELPADHKDEKAFRADFRLGGLRQRSFHITRQDAETYERVTITDYERGILNPTLRAAKRTFGEACDYYINTYMIPHQQLHDKRQLEIYRKMIGSTTPLSTIDQDFCKKIFAEVVARGIQIQTVIRQWTLLISIFRENHKWMPFNPAKGIITKAMRKKAQRRKEVYFTDEEYFKLLSLASTEEMKDILIIFRHTGFRKSEGKRCQHEHIDLTANTVHIPEQKNYESASIPLLPVARQRILEIRKRQGRTIGPVLDLTDITKRFRNLVKLAGLYKPYPYNKTLHSLRHSWGTYVQKNYKDLNVTKNLMRHKDIKMTMRYAHAANDLMRSAGMAGSATPPNQPSLDSGQFLDTKNEAVVKPTEKS